MSRRDTLVERWSSACEARPEAMHRSGPTKRPLPAQGELVESMSGFPLTLGSSKGERGVETGSGQGPM